MIGYRAWVADDDRLRPISRMVGIRVLDPWGAGANTFQCHIEVQYPTVAPCPQPGIMGPLCHCGLWMRESLDDVRDFVGPNLGWWWHEVHGYLGSYRTGDRIEKIIDVGPYVWGAVQAWGRIVEHEKGLRAQHAQPIGLLRSAVQKVLVVRQDWRDRIGGPDAASCVEVLYEPVDADIDAIGRHYDVPVFATDAELIQFAKSHEQSSVQ